MSKVVRSVKNVTKGYSSVQVKVRNGMRGSSSASIPRDHYICAYPLLATASLLSAVAMRGGGDSTVMDL